MKIVKTYEEFNLEKVYKTFGLKKLEIRSICKKYGITNYTINKDGSIDVDGNVALSNIEGMGGYFEKLTKLPLRFNKVSGFFHCNSNKLKSLEGCPVSVGGSFICNNNKLKSLEGCPVSVGGSFICYNNFLYSLEGCPKEVGGDFECSRNILQSLEGSPKKVGGDFICRRNHLMSLDGCAENIGGDFDCKENPVYEIWRIINDKQHLEVFLDYDIIRDDYTIILDRLNDFLDLIGKDSVKGVYGYKCI